MVQVNVLEAKNNLSGLLRSLEEGREDGVIIARHGKPVAKMVRYEPDGSKRFGAGVGKFKLPDDWDFNELDDEIAEMFGVS